MRISIFAFTLFCLTQATFVRETKYRIENFEWTVLSCPSRLNPVVPCDLVILGYASWQLSSCPENWINQECSIHLISSSLKKFGTGPYISIYEECKILSHLLWVDTNGLQLNRGTTFFQVADRGAELVKSLSIYLDLEFEFKNGVPDPHSNYISGIISASIPENEWPEQFYALSTMAPPNILFSYSDIA